MRQSLYFFRFFCLLLSTLAEYSDDFSRNVMFPLAVAAFDKNPSFCIKSGTGDGQLRRQIELSCDLSNETCSGYTAFSNSNNAIILGFRGSVGNEQYVEALEILFGQQRAFPGGAMAANFFYDTFLMLWNAGMKDDYLTLKQLNPTYEVWITGHSLGAAMAALAAGYLTQLGLADGNKVKLITYGEPRNGNNIYAAGIHNMIPFSYRVIHDNDWVPHLPFQWENYEHHGTEIFYPNNMTVGDRFTVCKGDEDRTCSLSVPPNRLEAAAHGFYYGTEIWRYQQRGCVY